MRIFPHDLRLAIDQSYLGCVGVDLVTGNAFCSLGPSSFASGLGISWETGDSSKKSANFWAGMIAPGALQICYRRKSRMFPATPISRRCFWTSWFRELAGGSSRSTSTTVRTVETQGSQSWPQDYSPKIRRFSKNRVGHRLVWQGRQQRHPANATGR